MHKFATLAVVLGSLASTSHYPQGDKKMARIEIQDDGFPSEIDVEKPKKMILGLDKPKRGMIGQSVDVPPRTKVTLLDWQVDDEESAIPVTVVIGPPNTVDVIPPGAFINRRLVAIVKYGVGGAQSELRMDVFPGNAITLVATYVRVEIDSDPTFLNNVVETVSGYICRFAIAHPPAKFTLANPLPIAPGTQQDFIIPTMARSVRVNVVFAPADAAWLLIVSDSAGLQILRKNMPAGTLSTEEVVLPGDAAMVSAVNPAGVNNMIRVRAVFDLY